MAKDRKQDALDALNALFSDTSTSRASTRENLKEIRDEIDIYLESLNDDEQE
jgi:hypothetical protein